MRSAYDPAMAAEPPRCAIVPPVPVPYREPLFGRLARRGRIAPRVIYQSGHLPGWDQRADWFPDRHEYESAVLRSWQRERPGRAPIVVPRGLGAALEEHDPRCVVSWEYGPATLRALAWCRRRGRALVIFSELTLAADRELSALQLRLHRALAPRVAAFVVASSAGRERLAAMGVPPERVEVSLQSADTERFRAAAKARAAERDGRVRVLSVGRLVPDQNVGLLLDAFGEAGLRPEEAELEVCGSGPLEAELRRKAERIGVPAHFRGYVAPDELPEVYAQADVLALVSTLEPFGVTVREGVAAGLPVICTTAAGAAADIAVDGRNAVLVDPRSRAEVASALRRLVDDRELRGRMAAESRAIADAADPDADAAAFERAVLSAIER